MSKPIGPIDEQYPTPTGAGNSIVATLPTSFFNTYFLFQISICLWTLGPAPCNVAEYEAYAAANLPRNAHGYYASGANDMITLRENRDAFARLRLMPKILVDVSSISMETTILGDKISSPICVAPTAMQRMAHNDGECATAKAAARYVTCNILHCFRSEI